MHKNYGKANNNEQLQSADVGYRRKEYKCIDTTLPTLKNITFLKYTVY